jgi:hypothetical protein
MMRIISSTGGGGSSFVADKFSENKWNVCLRPDGGHQKATHTAKQIYDERTSPYFITKLGNDATQEDMFREAYINLNKLPKEVSDKLMLLCMTWGGLGYLGGLQEKTIFLVRDPIFAFNSYSGGGWRKEGGARRIKYVDADGPNDKKWIDLWLNGFSFWKRGAENALTAVQSGAGDLVRYHNFVEDWSRLDGVPPIHKNFSSKDNPEKLKGFLTLNTIRYIREQTNDIWKEIKAYKHE